MEAKPALTLDGVVWKTGGIRRYYDKCVDYASTLPYPCMDGIMATLRKAYDKKKKCHRVFMNEEQNTMAKKPKRVDFPNLALIGFIYKGSKLIHWQCQGFIISERYLATAAHCGRFANNIGYETYIAVGIDKRTETDTPTKVNTQDKADYDESSSWQQYKAKRFIQHPEWDCNNMYNDIALVETETEIKFDFNVLPMCLADHTTIPETVQVDILGIDNIRNNTKVQLQILKHTNCSELFSANGELRYNTQTCYQGFNEPVETCMGSSGRPIYATGELKCMKYVVGFTSFGLSCNHPDSATVYTRIQTYIPWIESIVWP